MEQQRLAAAGGPRVEVIDRRSYETMQRLAGAGVLPLSGQGQELFRSGRLAESVAEQRRQRLARGAEVLGAAERKLRMALLLAEGGFLAEAMPMLDECVALASNARSLMTGDAKADDTIAAEPSVSHSQDDIVGTIGRLLGDISKHLGQLSLRRERHHPKTEQRPSLLSASRPPISVPLRRAWMRVCEHDG